MKKRGLKVFFITLISILFIFGCSSKQITDKVGLNISKEIVVDVVTPTPEPTVKIIPVPEQPKKIEMIIGTKGTSYNDNNELFDGSKTYTGVDRESTTLPIEKFYLDRTWDVMQDYSSSAGSGSLLVNTEAKSISLELSSPGYVDINVFKGVKILPDNEKGTNVEKLVDLNYGTKVNGHWVVNLIKRNASNPALYEFKINRNSVKFYKLILEY